MCLITLNLQHQCSQNVEPLLNIRPLLNVRPLLDNWPLLNPRTILSTRPCINDRQLGHFGFLASILSFQTQFRMQFLWNQWLQSNNWFLAALSVLMVSRQIEQISTLRSSSLAPLLTVLSIGNSSTNPSPHLKHLPSNRRLTSQSQR